MFFITLTESLPHSKTSQTKTLGALAIENAGTGTTELGDYTLQLYDAQGNPSSQGRITQFPRNKGTWALVREALMALNIDEA